MAPSKNLLDGGAGYPTNLTLKTNRDMSSIKFTIKNTQTKAVKESDGTIIRYSGVSEPFRRISERSATKIGVDPNGEPVLVYNTGLSDKQVDYYKWYTEAERKEIKKQIKELAPTISNYYGGEEVISDKNKYFWGEVRDVNRLSLTNDTMDTFYDTSNPVHALLYLSIVSGAFIDLVAPTKTWAEDKQLPHYLALDQEDMFEEDDEVTKSDAHGALSVLRKDGSPEALFILAWCLQYDTNGYGAYSRATPFRDLVNYHIKYIDGKLQLKKKKNTPKTFIEYAEKWEKQQTRPLLYIEAYIKAGQYYNFIQQREKKYVTAEGTVLGNTIPEAVENLQKAKFQPDFENLRDKVEAKWKE